MTNEVLDFLVFGKGTRGANEVYVDCTVGGGGHSEAILRATPEDTILVGIDRDREAIEAATESLAQFGGRARLIHGDFRRLPSILEQLGFKYVNGILMDLGISSHQVDKPDRGFSFSTDAPLDMRMNQEASVTARDLVNSLPEEELARIIDKYGEERFARRIARFIVEKRRFHEISTTGQLVDIIKAAIPAAYRRRGPHPARRTFQALRIAVNDELGALEETLKSAPGLLFPGGRIVVISYHSLEDRIVKRAFLAEPLLSPITKKPVTPSPDELSQNPRARSARLRVAERVLPAFEEE